MHDYAWRYFAFFLAAMAGALFILRFLSDRASGDREAFARSVAATARVLKVGNSTPSRSYRATVIDLLILVQRPGVESYELNTMWSVDPGSEPNVQPGKTFAVKIDPLNPKNIYSNETWARSLGVKKQPIDEQGK